MLQKMREKMRLFLLAKFCCKNTAIFGTKCYESIKNGNKFFNKNDNNLLAKMGPFFENFFSIFGETDMRNSEIYP